MAQGRTAAPIQRQQALRQKKTLRLSYLPLNRPSIVRNHLRCCVRPASAPSLTPLCMAILLRPVPLWYKLQPILHESARHSPSDIVGLAQILDRCRPSNRGGHWMPDLRPNLPWMMRRMTLVLSRRLPLRTSALRCLPSSTTTTTTTPRTRPSKDTCPVMITPMAP